MACFVFNFVPELLSFESEAIADEDDFSVLQSARPVRPLSQTQGSVKLSIDTPLLRRMSPSKWG